MKWPRTNLLRLTIILAVGAATVLFGSFVLANNEKEPLPPQEDPQITVAKEATYRAGMATTEPKAQVWLDQFRKSGIDPKSLPVVEFSGTAGTAYDSLPEAVNQAEAIVLGTVDEIEFQPNNTTLVTVNLEKVLKGLDEESTKVTVRFPGGAWYGAQGPDVPEGQLVVSSALPLLFPGDRAILFLRDTHYPSGVYQPQSFTGMYGIEGGQVGVIAENPFGEEIRGTSESNFIQKVLTLIR